MGKVTISEPVKGESLTVTKINSTIASWTTQASNIDGENVHDQSLDNYNFADNSVRSINSEPMHGNLLLRTLDRIPPIQVKRIYRSNETLNFTSHDHILRVSLHCNVFPNFAVVSFNSTAEFKIEISLSYSTSSSLENIPITFRKFQFEGNQLVRTVIDETITIVTHLNNLNGLKNESSVSGLSINAEVTFHFNEPLLLGEDRRMGIYGHFVEIETIKR
tara:strand:- start:11 stop:667 length:657 start_codon:yes stop_codon:yes gene_type:complete